MDEKTLTGAPADNGLSEINARLGAVLQAAEDAQAKAAASEKKSAELQAALDKVVAAQNKHAVNFAPAGAEKKGKNSLFKEFLKEVKSVGSGILYSAYAQKAALASNEHTGDYLVPTVHATEFLDLVDAHPSLISEARRMPWGSPGNTREISTLDAIPTVNDIAQGAAKQVSNPVFGKITQTLDKYGAIVLLTEELREDTDIDLQAIFNDSMARAFNDYYNAWLLNGKTNGKAGILSASGVLTPVIATAADLLGLKLAVPTKIARTGKFYIEKSLYGALAKVSKTSAPSWLNYENGVMKIDNSPVVVLDVAGDVVEGTAFFGDLAQGAIFSPRKDITVSFSKEAVIVDNTNESNPVTHNLFQENKEAYLFEARADITILGPYFAKAVVGEESGS